ncbi:MAG: deaminase [Pelagibacterium sp. SCN 63-23]|nr:MAG: deaminase [Pelagibacterium sp. SCN 63-23]
MTSGHVFIGISLDGFIARRDGDIAWLVGFSALGEDHGYDAHMARVDGIIMGRGTFEKMVGIEPWYYAVPVLVLSRSIDQSAVPPALAGKVEVLAAKPEEAMQVARARGWRGVYVDGGAVIQSFLRAGLIEDMVISRLPVLIGDGQPLFGMLDEDIALEHLGTKAFASGLVQSHYRVRR